MKKLFISTVAVAATFALTACVSEDQNLAPNEAGKGYIALNVTNDDALTTRTVQTVDDASTWTVSVSGPTDFSGTAAQLATTPFSAGPGYTIKASNYADLNAALAANNELGDAYYEGTSESFEVTAGGTATPSVACGTAKNARLTINASAFDNITITSMTITAGSRIVRFPTTASTTEAYFKAGEELTLNINYTAAGGAKSFSKDIAALTAATANTITLATNQNGLISLTITYNDTFTDGTSATYTFDAATGDEITPAP